MAQILKCWCPNGKAATVAMPARPPAGLPRVLFPSQAAPTRPEAVPSGVENWEALWGAVLCFEAFPELIR